MQKISNIFQNGKILVLDGSTGTFLQGFNLTAKDFGGEQYLGCNENLVITRPDVVTKVHEAYLEAGADIIETNSFGGTSIVLEDYGLEAKATELNRAAAGLARAAADRFSTAEKQRFVAGSMGPTTKSLSLTGGVTFDEMANSYAEQATALIEGGCDYLLLETAMDTLNLKAGYIGIQQACEKLKRTIPIAISVTIEASGTMLAGQGIEALYASVEHMNPLYIGLNCATGASQMKEHIRRLSEISRFPVSVAPNAGMPDEEGNYSETPEAMAKTISEYANAGWIQVAGGCCGTMPAHIKAVASLPHPPAPLSRVLERREIQLSPSPSRRWRDGEGLGVGLTRISGIDPLTIEDSGRPYIVGERANVIGSRLFKELIAAEKFDEAVETIRRQVKGGAHIIDVCVSNPDRDETTDMIALLSKAKTAVKVPFMIDSLDAKVVEAAFKLLQGKSILNSINLENGEKAFETMAPLIKKYGAAVIVGCISETMALTAKDKLAVAMRSYDLLTSKYGLNESDIIFDPLVFPCGTGEENYFGSGKETIEAVYLIKEKYPNCKTVLGVSNVSFGLPAAGREALNSALLYHATQAGLDLAIVNAEKIARYSSLTLEEKKLCDDLLWYRTESGNDPIGNFVSYYREKQPTSNQSTNDLTENLPVEQRLANKIVEGSKDKLIEDLTELLNKQTPIDIINGPLMTGMAKVGELFKNNELIVAEVLQSAEVMKAAVNHLEPLMADKKANVRGTMLLATVSGDVHDIGKNLTNIILSNNGFQIIDLGIKCPSQAVIEAFQKQPANMIGFSGLLVKSVQQMAITAGDLKAAGISVPLLLGGAALSKRFVEEKIQPIYDGKVYYCADAMTGLEVALKVSSNLNPSVGQTLDELNSNPSVASRHLPFSGERTASIGISSPLIRGEYKGGSHLIPSEHKGGSHSNRSERNGESILNSTLFTPTIPDTWQYLNETIIYTRYLGYKGPFEKDLTAGNPKAMELKTKVEIIKQKILQDNLIELKGAFQLFDTISENNDIILLANNQETARFTFPRQNGKENLCLADYITNKDSGKIDSLALFVVTCGHKSEAVSKQWIEQGQYLDSQILNALAFETAEALAELLHKHIRELWGIIDNPDLTKSNIFQAKYQGCRYSFGYPACPNMEDQVKLWSLLRPDKQIGVALTEGFMMSPEASVSAIVFQHPEAKYFSV